MSLLSTCLLAATTACSHPTGVIGETPDAAAVAGTVTQGSGAPVAGAAVSIAAFGMAGSQYIATFTAQTGSGGDYVRQLVLGPLGLQQCLLRITVTPPTGSGLAGKTDSVTARVNSGTPATDTAFVNFVLTP